MRVRLGELAELVAGKVRGDASRSLTGVSTLADATPSELSFFSNRSYLESARSSDAGAILVPPGMESLPQDLLVVENPYLALARILSKLHPLEAPLPGIHESAVLSEGVRIAESAAVGPFCCIGEDSIVEEGAVLHANCVVGRACIVGPGSVLHPLVTLYDGTVLGRNVIVHSGVVLGGDGFGFAQSPTGHVKVPQVGCVVVEDDVEIGANSTIDRAMLRETRIGAGTKIDNLVMVAHNVQVGRDCLLISQVGIAGSATLGAGVVVAGQSGVSGHVDLGDGVQVASKSAVYKSVGKGTHLAGIPAIDSMDWRRLQVRLRRLQSVEARLAEVERKLLQSRESEERP